MYIDVHGATPAQEDTSLKDSTGKTYAMDKQLLPVVIWDVIIYPYLSIGTVKPVV